MSRTRPTKLATPPMRVLPRLSASNSAPTSKSSRCTRIIGSPSGHRREERDLVAVRERMAAPDIIVIDRDADRLGFRERLAPAGAARPQPLDKARDIAHLGGQHHLLLGDADARAQPGEIEQLHPITSAKERKSTTAPGITAPAASPRMTSPSELTIEERMPAPSRRNFSATRTSPSRLRLARRYSRRPGFLR